MIEGRGLDSNVYVFEDIIVDTGTGDNIQYILDSIRKAGLNPDDLSMIVNTHNHYDHIGGNRYLDLKVAMHRKDALILEKGDMDATVANMFGKSIDGMKVDLKLEEGDKIHNFKVLHTPGHTAGGICLYDGENLISGDTVFTNGGFGRTDIGGNMNDMRESLTRLSKLDVGYIFPGHGPAANNGSIHVKMAYESLRGF